MKVTILSHGTRGDVQPFLSLAIALRDAGHEPLLLAPENFSSVISKAKIPFIGFPGDVQKLMATPEAAAVLEKGDVRAFLSGYAQAFADHFKVMEEQSLNASRGANVIVAGIGCFEDAFSISEKLNIPVCLVSLCPSIPATGVFPHPFLLTSNLPFCFMNKLTYWIFEYIHWTSCKDGVSAFRKKIGLPNLKKPILRAIIDREIPIIHSFSPSLSVIPPDWPGKNCIAGFFESSKELSELTDQSPPEKLIQWLREGSKPIFFGFGSMPMKNTEKMIGLIEEVTKALGERAIIATGWSPQANQEAAKNIFTIKNINFDWLFPQCSVVVHQGGAGTTHTSLRSGVATLICAFIADQFYWGERVKKMGAGTWFRYQELNSAKLLEGLKYCLTPAIQRGAISLSKKMKNEEDGKAKAIRFIETFAKI